MKNKYKHLLISIIFFSMTFLQIHAVCFAAQEDINSEISDNSKITKIEFEGNHLINSSDIVKVMNMQIGDVYSKELVQQNLKAIYKTGYFSEKMKAIPIPNDSDSLTLRIYLEENIPITGFAHSMTSAALDYKNEGPIYGIGANIFKLAGSVILYGIISAWLFAMIRYLLGGVI